VCRLVAYLGEDLPSGSLVFGGEHSLYRQSWAPRELLSGSVNADGWGVVWYSGEMPRRLAEARPIWYEDDLRGVLDAVRSTCVVAALRNGTPGLAVDRTALLPMVRGRWSFVLNGFVPDFRSRHMRALREELPDHLYAALRGSSDSETLFLSTLAAMEDGADARQALTRTVTRVLSRLGSSGSECQLTLLLADGESLTVVRTSNVKETNSLYLGRATRLAPEGSILASEPLTEDDDWEPVPPHHLLSMDRTGVLLEPLARN